MKKNNKSYQKKLNNYLNLNKGITVPKKYADNAFSYNYPFNKVALTTLLPIAAISLLPTKGTAQSCGVQTDIRPGGANGGIYAGCPNLFVDLNGNGASPEINLFKLATGKFAVGTVQLSGTYVGGPFTAPFNEGAISTSTRVSFTPPAIGGTIVVGIEKGSRLGFIEVGIDGSGCPTIVKVGTGLETTVTPGVCASLFPAAASPSISIATVTASSAENSGTALKYRFTASAAPSSDLTINFEITSASSAANDDFVVTTGGTNSVSYNTSTKKGTIVIKSGETTADLSIVPTGDAIIEDNETVIVSVTTP